MLIFTDSLCACKSFINVYSLLYAANVLRHCLLEAELLQ